jgi:hypothetical protein
MPALIRMAGETDAEFAKRTQPLIAALSSELFRREFVKIVEGRNVLERHLRAGRVREIASEVRWRPKRLQAGETFKWDVWEPKDG